MLLGAPGVNDSLSYPMPSPIPSSCVFYRGAATSLAAIRVQLEGGDKVVDDAQSTNSEKSID